MMKTLKSSILRMVKNLTNNNSMKNIFLLLLFAPFFSFSQEIAGIWSHNSAPNQALQFNPDGTFELIDLTNNEKILKNITVTYKLTSKDDVTIIEFLYYRNNTLIEKEEVKYKLVNDELYLPHEHIINGVKSVEDYADMYTRIK